MPVGISMFPDLKWNTFKFYIGWKWRSSVFSCLDFLRLQFLLGCGQSVLKDGPSLPFCDQFVWKSVLNLNSMCDAMRSHILTRQSLKAGVVLIHYSQILGTSGNILGSFVLCFIDTIIHILFNLNTQPPDLVFLTQASQRLLFCPHKELNKSA